jgi:D-alanyl-lipoteichoic acid acyltransferase DltB (MBOAT superfamily)
MLFNSLAYLLLLTGSVAWVALLPRPALGLILASVLFYAAAGPFDSAVFLVSVTLNWLVQVAFPPQRGRLRIAAAVVLNVGLIGYFKYRNWLFGDGAHLGSYIDIALPLGISFYSLQALAYHIDVARGRDAQARTFAEFLLFKAFFPQLIAGPIVRIWQLLPQVQRLFEGKLRKHRLLAFGLGLIVMGLIKKVVLADSIGPIVDEIFAAPPGGAYRAWLGAVLFSFQIYFDFSGYSDIAIGSAFLLGIRLPRNFATPFLATSIADFWQRWHITLSRFLRDYVYLSLAGLRWVPRHVRAAQFFGAMILTMTLCGLWHGAGWTFVVWGALHGVALVAATFWSRYLPALPVWLAWAATFGFFAVTSVIFRSPNLGFALDYLQTMLWFGGGLPMAADGAAPLWQVAIGIAALFALHGGEFYVQRRSMLYVLRRADGPLLRGLLAGVAVLIVLIPSNNANPFIYFRF